MTRYSGAGANRFHHQVAELLTSRFPETVASQPEIAAHHFTAAGVYKPAIDYWRQAGQQASARSAQAEAIRHFTQGIDSGFTTFQSSSV